MALISKRIAAQPNRIWLAVVVSSILLIATACGSGAATPASASTDAPAAAVATQADVAASNADACTLLTQADVAKVLGSAVDSAEASGLGGTCTYKAGNTRIDLSLSHTGGKKAMEQTQASLGDMALAVPGLGDLAFYNTNSASALFVLKGDAEYMFSMSDMTYQPMDMSYVQTTEKALAEQLLSNLP
jgi:hypothetical protein